ncbi:reverse transcriptase domain-containing protein [Tanacetum coccineum]
MLERLSGNEFYCFLDGFSSFFQIPIAPEDQENITFTCPYGNFAYRRMPFGLCNAPATFQRCMTAIFHDMVEDFMEGFMVDFLVFGNSFDHCLNNLDKMLARCEETNLVLNWEKCHFMAKEGIVLGYKISRKGIEVDKAKIDVIAKLPYPTNVKGVRSFLGHAGFYRRFIKDFSMISKPMTHLLMKDAKFDFSDDCKKAFNNLKEKLTTAPIIISPNWNVPFELMCDASDFAVGAVLGQRIEGKFKPIYYASQTLNDTQAHYTTTEKELLAVGAENLADDHLSRLENPNMGILTKKEIADESPDEHQMVLKATPEDDEPCNYGVTCKDEAKRRNSGTKTKTFEENCYLLLYAVSNKEDTAYLRQLITRIRVMINSLYGVSLFINTPYAQLVINAGRHVRACVLDFRKSWDSQLSLVNFHIKQVPYKYLRVNSTFHVLNLKKCISDVTLAIPLDEIQIDDKLHFIEEPVEIMDCDVKRLKQSHIPIVKVRWNSRRGHEFTWEREDQTQKKYPPSSSPTVHPWHMYVLSFEGQRSFNEEKI